MPVKQGDDLTGLGNDPHRRRTALVGGAVVAVDLEQVGDPVDQTHEVDCVLSFGPGVNRLQPAMVGLAGPDALSVGGGFSVADRLFGVGGNDRGIQRSLQSVPGQLSGERRQLPVDLGGGDLGEVAGGFGDLLALPTLHSTDGDGCPQDREPMPQIQGVSDQVFGGPFADVADHPQFKGCSFGDLGGAFAAEPLRPLDQH